MGFSTDIKLVFLLIFVFVLVWLFFAGAAAARANQRGARTLSWLILGVLGGPFAWLGSFYTGSTCPHCRSKIHRRATTCPRCLKPQTAGGTSPIDETSPEALIAQSDRQER